MLARVRSIIGTPRLLCNNRHTTANELEQPPVEWSGRRVPIIALTASVLIEALKKARDAGCDAHVAKPVKKAVLLAAIQKAIGDAKDR